MGRNCFILGCKANKWRNKRRTQTQHRAPAFFGFPKSKSLFEEWSKAIPRRRFHEREPTENDHICSLHFKLDDVQKYYEYSCFRGLPKTQVVKLERGTWALKPNSVPCYFNDDNPDEEHLIRDVKHRVTGNSQSRNRRTQQTRKKILGDSSAAASVVTADETLASETTGEVSPPKEEFPTLEEESSMTSTGDTSSDSMMSAMVLDHSYHMPASNSEIKLTQKVPQTSKGKLKYDPYTIEQLHQDVLDVVLPKNWTFFQIDDDYVTVFLLNNSDNEVCKSIRFAGSCRPIVTVRNNVTEHRRVNSKQEIQDLILFVSVM